MIAENTPEWFAARVGIPTASLLSDIMSNERGNKGGPGAPFFKLVDEKCAEIIAGVIRPTGTSFAAQRGVDLEPLALKVYAEMTGEVIRKPGLLMHKSLRFGASPDAVRVSDGNIVEVKCPESWPAVVRLRCDQDVSDYRDQIQGQLCVTGAAWCDLVVFDDRLPPDSAMTVIRVPRDEKHIARIEERVKLFNEAVQQRVQQFRSIK